MRGFASLALLLLQSAACECCLVLQAERADKLRLVQVYNLRLDERVARKAHIQARDLLNLRHYQVLPISYPNW